MIQKIADLEILAQKYKCSVCKKEKVGTEFHLRRAKGKKRQVDYRCKECCKTREQNKPQCPTCDKYVILDSNGLCRRCNADYGLKQCKKCRQLKFQYIDFDNINYDSRKWKVNCKDCS